MAKNDDKGQGAPAPNPPEGNPDGGGSTPPAAPDYGSEINSLKETIAKQGETIGKLSEFVDLSSTLINTVATDPTLSEQVRNKVSGQQGVPTQQQNQNPNQNQNNNQPSGPSEEYTRKIEDVAGSQRDNIIHDFEKSYGIDQLTGDEQKKVKQEVADYLADFGWQVTKIPLVQLRQSLEKAYMGSVGFSKLKEEGKLEGVIQARQNAQGMMGNFSGGTPDYDQTGQLTPKQAEWVAKLRVDPDKAKKTYQDRGNEQQREKPVKQ